MICETVETDDIYVVSDVYITSFFNLEGYDLDINKSEAHKWYGFSTWYGYSKGGLAKKESRHFGRVIAYFFCNKLIDDDVSKYFHESKILVYLQKKYDELGILCETELQVAIGFFNFALHFYIEEIDDYTYRSKRMSFVITEGTYERFMEIPGDTKNDKLIHLIKNYKYN